MNSINDSRKIILFIVEGISDEVALFDLFQARFENDHHIVRFIRRNAQGNKDKHGDGGDFTSDDRIDPESIQYYIYNEAVKHFLRKSKKEECKYYEEDIEQIIHIVDIDGVFINDSKFENFSDENYHSKSLLKFKRLNEDKEGENESENSNWTFYDVRNEKIICYNAKGIKIRNERKRRNLEKLVQLEFLDNGGTTKTKDKRKNLKIEKEKSEKKKYEKKKKESLIPYSVYFFSCNLDHVCFSIPNLVKGKTKMAEEFRDKHKNDFVDFFTNPENCFANKTYEESWNLIQQSQNGFLPKTNINVLIEELSEK